MSLHHVRLLEEEHGALDRASQEAFDTLAKKRFTVFYVAVLVRPCAWAVEPAVFVPKVV